MKLILWPVFSLDCHLTKYTKCLSCNTWQYLAITDKIYQVSRNNEADPPFLPFSLQMQDHLAELSAEQQFANFELVFKCNCIQDFPSVS